jgi:hypothetical protein
MVSKYDQFKEKWHNWNDPYPGLDNLGPGKFCLRLYDYDEKGSSATASTLVFEDVFDAIGFIRFKQMAVILDSDSKTKSPEDSYKYPEEYLEKYEGAEKKKFKKIIDAFDAVLKASKPDKDSLEDLRIDFNHVFARTKPVNEIQAWGRLRDYLDFECFEEVLKGEKPEEDEDDNVKEKKYRNLDGDEDEAEISYMQNDENVEEECHSELKELLNSDKFDDHNEEHIILAINFLEEQEIV